MDTISPSEITGLASFAGLVVILLMLYIRAQSKQHQEERKSSEQRFESLVQRIANVTTENTEMTRSTNTVLQQVAAGQQALTKSVDRLSEQSKTSTDYATLLVDTLRRGIRAQRPRQRKK